MCIKDCVCWGPPDEERQASRAIDYEIRVRMREMRRTIKLLLLGAGEAGKSTMVKQMKIFHEKGYTNDELKTFVPYIHSNLLEAVFRLAEARVSFNYALENKENIQHEQLILSTKRESLETPIILSPEIFTAISSLWRDAGIQQAFARRNELQLNDSVEYFMKQLEEIRKNDFVPKQDDVLHVRVRTTSISEYSFDKDKCRFRIVDVGGQRTERRKWIHCFEGVNYIFYVASLSDYSKTLTEDGGVNRMEESLALFRVILKDEFLENSAIILFLNKTDKFEEDIEKHNLSKYFPKYQGPTQDAESAKEFILKMYLECNPNKYRPIFHHFTCCVDTKQFQQVFRIVRFHIIDRATREGGTPV